MFGGDLVPPVNPKHRKPERMVHDVQLPCTQPNRYGHMGRQPNTDYHVRLLHYKQRMLTANFERMKANANELLKQNITIKYDKHAEKKNFYRKVEDRVNQKMAEYEAEIEKRRDKLREMLDLEEREFYKEVVENAQRGNESRLDDMRRRLQEIHAKREKEREDIVKQKRLQQFIARSVDLRPKLTYKNLIESKDCQLQQMRENEARREAERQTDKMWYDLMMKEYQAKVDREEQDAIEKRNRDKEAGNLLAMQVKARELMKADEEKLVEEDRIELERLKEQIKREEIEALEKKRKKRDEFARELREQIASQEEFMARRKEQEDALDQAFRRLNDLETEKERSKQEDTTTTARKEMAQYRAHLKELEIERKQEEMLLNKLLAEYQELIEEKKEEARCRLKKAKEDLQKSVMKSREEQLQYKQREAKEQLKMKQAENELLRLAYETNSRLEAENARLKFEAVQQYRNDLKKQIEYNEEIRKREKAELDRQLREGLEEEERFAKLVEELQKSSEMKNEKHPFRRVLEQRECFCPPNPFGMKPF